MAARDLRGQHQRGGFLSYRAAASSFCSASRLRLLLRRHHPRRQPEESGPAPFARWARRPPLPVASSTANEVCPVVVSTSHEILAMKVSIRTLCPWHGPRARGRRSSGLTVALAGPRQATPISQKQTSGRGWLLQLDRTKKVTTSRAVPQPFFTPVRRRASGTKG